MTLATVSLDDKYALESGRVYLNGVQALVRLPMMERQRDAAARRPRGAVSEQHEARRCRRKCLDAILVMPAKASTGSRLRAERDLGQGFPALASGHQAGRAARHGHDDRPRRAVTGREHLDHVAVVR